jgi:hypothetical protein
LELTDEVGDLVFDQQSTSLDLEGRAGRMLRIQRAEQAAHGRDTGTTTLPEALDVRAKRRDRRQPAASRVLARDLERFVIEQVGRAEQRCFDAGRARPSFTMRAMTLGLHGNAEEG